MADNPILEPVDLIYPTAATEEPEGPTEEAVANVEDQADENPTDQPGDESEETEGVEEAEANEDDEKESVYLELDGEEIDLEDVRKWRDGHLMQSDYTRKTTELAEQRKAVEREAQEVMAIKTKLQDTQSQLLALIEEDSNINWDELREDDLEEYVIAKERAEKRKETAEKIKEQLANPVVPDDVIHQEQKLLFEANPSWIDDKGKPTKAHKADTEMLVKYWQDNGFTEEEVGAMYRARHIETCLKAAKFDELQKKSESFVKKAKKAPLVTKPKARGAKADKPKSLAELIYS